MPNTDGEIHLEKQEKKSIWKEYVEQHQFDGKQYLGYDAFRKLWDCAFPFVKVRAYKHVSGMSYNCLLN
jgi:hypothetical protein